MHGIVFFNDTATTEIYTLSLHDALPILLQNALHYSVDSWASVRVNVEPEKNIVEVVCKSRGRPEQIERLKQIFHRMEQEPEDRKSTRLNSSHANISYAVFCLKKKQAEAG